ncbi:MAG TPA: FKBP-type peptidyl-prolyl cis-trans isomerase [Thermoanaerobaculia bacterium]|jgi:FKBP-type peptidyl-prolyl cis-trans isomerase|nr:FKBP-type peptidyl-prolyl cis-trans isomerase [Thermoanaerobaculia bacterium]
MKSMIVIAALVLAACSTPAAAPVVTETKAQPAGDVFSIPKNLQTTHTGLKYSIEREGTGPAAFLTQTVSVHYTGWLESGMKFDSSRDRGQPLEFPLGMSRVIKGWDEGIAGMKVGEVRRLVIPSALGYGERGGGGGRIPPNATLVFRIELLEVK